MVCVPGTQWQHDMPQIALMIISLFLQVNHRVQIDYLEHGFFEEEITVCARDLITTCACVQSDIDELVRLCELISLQSYVKFSRETIHVVCNCFQKSLFGARMTLEIRVVTELQFDFRFYTV